MQLDKICVLAILIPAGQSYTIYDSNTGFSEHRPHPNTQTISTEDFYYEPPKKVTMPDFLTFLRNYDKGEWLGKASNLVSEHEVASL